MTYIPAAALHSEWGWGQQYYVHKGTLRELIAAGLVSPERGTNCRAHLTPPM